MKKFLITILIVLFGIPCAFAQWGGQDPFPPKKQSRPGEPMFDTTSTIIKKSNPDGIIGHPSLTLWAGFGGGTIKNSIGRINLPNGDASSYTLRADVIYPATKSTSLLLQIGITGESQSFPETSEYYNEKISLNGYGIVVGVRIFSGW
jgi:hypothetical protein